MTRLPLRPYLDILDRHAGRRHSETGTVARALAEILARHADDILASQSLASVGSLGGMSWSEAARNLVESTPPPHCDQAVLHAPGVCRYCDARPDWQALRELWGIAYTGHQPTDAQISCPSDFRRGLGAAGQHWPGNRPEPG